MTDLQLESSCRENFKFVVTVNKTVSLGRIVTVFYLSYVWIYNRELLLKHFQIKRLQYHQANVRINLALIHTLCEMN